MPRGRARRGGADPEHQHRADGHLEEVVAQPQHLPDDEGQADQQPQTPPAQPHRDRKKHGQTDAGNHAHDPVQAALEDADRCQLHDEERRERREQRRVRPGEQLLGDDVARNGRQRQAQRPAQRGPAGATEPLTQPAEGRAHVAEGTPGTKGLRRRYGGHRFRVAGEASGPKPT